MRLLAFSSPLLPPGSLSAPLCSPSAPSFSLGGNAFLQIQTRASIQLVLDADQRGADYGSTDRPPCYLLLLPSCFFALALPLYFELPATCSNSSLYQVRYYVRDHLISTPLITASASLCSIRLSGQGILILL